MHRWARAGVVLVALVALSLTACGSDEPDAVTGPDGEIDCGAVITPSVAAALGWDTAAANFQQPEVSDGRCELTYPGLGRVTVGSIDGEGTAQQRVDDACGAMKVDDDLTADLVGGGQGCATGPARDVQTGLAELVLLTSDDVVLQIRIDAKAPLSPDRLRGGLRELVRTAQQAW